MEQIWLIKTNHIILGPFAEKEILAYLRTKTFSKLDSVLGINEDLWYPLVDHRYFKNIIANLDGQEPTIETTYLTQSESASIKEFVPPAELESTVIKIEPKIRRAASAPTVYLPPISPVSKPTQAVNKSYSVGGFIKLLLAIILIIFVSYWGRGEFVKYQNHRQEGKALIQAREDLKQFRYELAEIKLWKLYQTDFDLLESADLLALSQLLLNKGKIDLAREVYYKIVTPSAYIEWRSWSLIGLYLKMFNQEWSSALELAEEIDKGLENDMELELAKAYIYVQLKQYILADQLVEMLLIRYSKVQPLVSFLVLLKGQMFLEQNKTSSVVFIPDREQTLSLLNQSVDEYDPYFWQKKLLTLFIQASQKEEITLEDLTPLTQNNPFDAEYFFAPLSLWQFPFGKQLLSDLCINLVSTVDPNHKISMVKAIELVCLYQVGQVELLTSNLDLYKKTYTNDPYLISAEALIDQHKQRQSKSAIAPNCPKQMFWCQLSQVIYCEQSGDLQCMSEAVKESDVKQMGPSLILIKAKMAKRKGDDFYSRDLISKGLQSYQNYQPLMERKL